MAIALGSVAIVIGIGAAIYFAIKIVGLSSSISAPANAAWGTSSVPRFASGAFGT